MKPPGFFSGLGAFSVTALESPMMVRGISAAAMVTSWVQQETTVALTLPGPSVAEKNSWPSSGKGVVEFCVHVVGAQPCGGESRNKVGLP